MNAQVLDKAFIKPMPTIDPIVNRLDVEKTSAPMILVLGQTGAGKSYFCNKVLGEDCKEAKESARLESCMPRHEMHIEIIPC